MYELPLDHPVRPLLERLLPDQSVLWDERSLARAGFQTAAPSGRSKLLVVSHASLEGWLLKVLPAKLSKDRKRSTKELFEERCEYARRLQRLIDEVPLRHFVVPEKWVYGVGELCVLVVSRMPLLGEEESARIWREAGEEVVRELRLILSTGHASRSLKRNVLPTADGLFACIDTESNRGAGRLHNFKKVSKYLSPELAARWEASGDSPELSERS